MTFGAETTGKATGGRITWLGAEWPEGKAEEPERPAVLGEGGRSQSLHSTDAAGQRREGRIGKPRRGKGGRKLDAEGTDGPKESLDSARQC
jgi:hypothetical protein